MNETEFNLIDETWIRVMDSNCHVAEVSLTDALVNAHEYKALKGELPTQDVAVMRLLLAVLHTVISCYDAKGNEEALSDNKKAAVKRWKGYWDNGRFPEKAVKDYLEAWHERFWLFHPERPFFQVAGLDSGTDYDSPKLNGEISESSNKIRLFSSYSGKEKSELTYSQAARWLLYLNGYDDTSSKPTKEGKSKAGGSLPSPGVGWLGKLGLIYLTGNNLFETLMLNLVMIAYGNKVQYDQHPLWEWDNVPTAERVQIIMPHDLAALYTIQSRRLLLKRENGMVTGYKLLGGDFFDKENAFFEPMTVWRMPKKGDDKYTPMRHDSSKQMWRDFSSIYTEKDSNHRAEVLNWYSNVLYGEEYISEKYLLKTTIASVEYGDKDFFVKNVFGDSLEMHSSLLSELGANARNSIEGEIAKCDKMAYYMGQFAQDLFVASGGSKSDKDKHYVDTPKQAKEQLYYRLDVPFRRWLRSIDPKKDTLLPEIYRQWQKTACDIALNYAKELVGELPESAVYGHVVKNDKSTTIYSAPKALNILRRNIRKIYERT